MSAAQPLQVVVVCEQPVSALTHIYHLMPHLSPKPADGIVGQG